MKWAVDLVTSKSIRMKVCTPEFYCRVAKVL